MCEPLLILKVDTLDTVGDGREDFVGDGIDDVTEDSNGQMFAKDLHLITLQTRDVGDVDHRHIHTDIAHVLCLLTMHQAIAMTVAQMTVQTVCLANRYGSNHRVALDFTFTTVAHSITCRNMTKL